MMHAIELAICGLMIGNMKVFQMMEQFCMVLKKKMIKKHELKTITANYECVSFFYVREKASKNGISRFRVFILDSETPHAYETIFQCYEFQIPARVRDFVENAAGEE